jgi:hypothetical protein
MNGNWPIALRSKLSRRWGCDADDNGESSQDEQPKPHGSLLFRLPSAGIYFQRLARWGWRIASDIVKLPEVPNLWRYYFLDLCFAWRVSTQRSMQFEGAFPGWQWLARADYFASFWDLRPWTAPDVVFIGLLSGTEAVAGGGE